MDKKKFNKMLEDFNSMYEAYMLEENSHVDSEGLTIDYMEKLHSVDAVADFLAALDEEGEKK